MLILYIPFALFILYTFNNLTNNLVTQREIPEEKHPQIFRTINVLITILLISSYIEILFT
ncbi:hypothetical protein [Bacillus marinisedimentorum]|uniref:hypothetical protein n=1 Tax=Bacillus marinisedimentorum TaxID=1821260 RepID=UPI0007DEDEDA|nr:hypothetical protein [Bacillus marinisedimentorum]